MSSLNAHLPVYLQVALLASQARGGGFDVEDENVSWKQDKKSSLLAFLF
jgi:hypothetical protein